MQAGKHVTQFQTKRLFGIETPAANRSLAFSTSTQVV
jgi:hypothetical protein